ncbi:PREDICTED: uncharacterized protein LOC105359101 [Ceratosolen solmsi marchali]|uniref:Uncharacterized protein LOC105359101 n=1 Tax=Ceratosolen solmsi marchali TaxID=326594 RepID=A0AAJ6VK69_9HYME|nr:PREDICTED: uncharacterized protein LOC105359101 [Ceratosolen solmsi marchali]
MTLRVMNERFKSRLDEKYFEGVRDEKIYHGLKVTSSTILDKVFTNICFCTKTQEYLVLDKGVRMMRYSMQGQRLHPSFSLTSNGFTQMLWCDNVNCFACYDPSGETIMFLSTTCVILKTIANEFQTKGVYYEPKSNEITVVGTNQIVKYLLDFEMEELEPIKPLKYNDSEFGATWQLECTHMILEGAVESQLVASYSTTLYLFPLELNDDEADVITGIEFLEKRTNASKAPITVIYFYESSSWIIIGDHQGNVSAWTLKLECIISSNGIHNKPVFGIISHPSICGFITYTQGNGSGNGKMQVWSCNLREQLESFESLGIISAIVANNQTASVIVLGSKITFLTMHQIYCFYAPLTCSAVNLFTTNTPMYSTKIVATCADNSVRLFASNANQINVQILSQQSLNATSATYSEMKNTLFTVISKSGDILVSDTSVYPMNFKHVIINDGSQITCMTMFEYFDEIRYSDGRPRKPRLFHPIGILIIAGTEDGDIIVIDNDTGKSKSTYSAHKGSVAKLTASSRWNQVISLGVDRCIKVWRVLADLPICLIIYYSLYFITPITQVTSIGDVLCMVNSSKHSKRHQLIMENMSQRVHLEHESIQDHTALITSIITNEILEICATSSSDNTIRLWDRENCLLKILNMNICIWNMTFSSARGDIVFGAGRHLYKIPYENYLSPKYRMKIITNEIANEEDEFIASKCLQNNNSDDQNAMLHPVSSMPLGCIDIRNTDILSVDVLILRQICAILNYRDKEIMKIKNNYMKPKNVVLSKGVLNTEDWEKYVQNLLNSMSRHSPEKPPYNFLNYYKEKSKVKKSFNERGVFHMLFGYDIDNLDSNENITDLIKNSRLPITGFLPNSVLYMPYKEIIKPKIVVEKKAKRKFVKYEYPLKFYPQEPKTSEGQISLNLSQILLTDTVEGGENAA